MSHHSTDRNFDEELRVLVASTSPDRPIVERIEVVIRALLLTLERHGIGTDAEIASMRAILDRS